MGIHRPTHLLRGIAAASLAGTSVATSARNTGASVAPLTAGQVVPAAAILAVIVMLSAAITDRLRLRRLRR